MMNMYSKSEIERLKLDKEFLTQEGDKYCLVNLYQGHRLTNKDVHNQANFCVIQSVLAYMDKKITLDKFNKIIDKIDLFVYANDLLGARKAIEKLNQEVIEEELHIPHFNALCVLCEDLYDSF